YLPNGTGISVARPGAQSHAVKRVGGEFSARHIDDFMRVIRARADGVGREGDSGVRSTVGRKYRRKVSVRIDIKENAEPIRPGAVDKTLALCAAEIVEQSRVHRE